MVGRWFRVLWSVTKSMRIEVGADGYGSSKRFGIETESGVEVFIEVGIAGYDEALGLVWRVD